MYKLAYTLPYKLAYTVTYKLAYTVPYNLAYTVPYNLAYKVSTVLDTQPGAAWAGALNPGCGGGRGAMITLHWLHYTKLITLQYSELQYSRLEWV